MHFAVHEYDNCCGCPTCWAQHLEKLAAEGHVPKYEVGDFVRVLKLNSAHKMQRVNSMQLNRGTPTIFRYIVGRSLRYFHEDELVLYVEKGDDDDPCKSTNAEGHNDVSRVGLCM